MITNILNMILLCPSCGIQHVDKAEPDVCEDCGHVFKWHFEGDNLPSGRTGCGHPNCVCESFNPWINPPHKSHRCASCNTVWRPADFCTNGVAEIKTRGQGDTWPTTNQEENHA